MCARRCYHYIKGHMWSEEYPESDISNKTEFYKGWASLMFNKPAFVAISGDWRWSSLINQCTARQDTLGSDFSLVFLHRSKRKRGCWHCFLVHRQKLWFSLIMLFHWSVDLPDPPSWLLSQQDIGKGRASVPASGVQILGNQAMLEAAALIFLSSKNRCCWKQ